MATLFDQIHDVQQNQENIRAKADTANKRAVAAEEKASKAAAAAPEIVVDATGQPKLIVKSSGETTPARSASKPSTEKPKRTDRGVEFPIHF
jgi:hypothetical protein